MSNGKFEMKLIVPTKLVGAVVELMEGEGIIVHMAPFVEENKTKPRKGSGQHYAGGKRDKGISGNEAVMAILKESKLALTAEQVGKKMAERWGFSANSASPVLSKLQADKKVKRVDDKFLPV